MDNEITRRTFLVLSGALGLTAVLQAAPGSGRGATKGEEEKGGYNWEDYSYAYLIDTTRCIGCGMCVQACKRENGVPDGFFRTWVERYRIGEGGKVEVDSPNGALTGFQPTMVDFKVTKAFFVPKLCNHCKNTPCTQVCPVGAAYTTKEGVVMVDQDHCIGCGYCVQACPYGARLFNEEEGVSDKCNWCYHRITKGMQPACVEVCPVGARIFGDRRDKDSPISLFIRNNRVQVLKPETGNAPNVFYVGIDKEVR